MTPPDLPPLPPDASCDDDASVLNLAALPTDEVVQGLMLWAGRVAAGEARLLAFLGEFDAREEWARQGFPSCVSWLAWRLGMGSKAASERVRVARALRDLPVLRATYERGEVSFTQVRAVTRLAGLQPEEDLIAMARSASGAQIERLARGVRRAQHLNAADQDPQSTGRPAVTTRYDEDGTLVLTARFPAEQGAELLAALEAARTKLDQEIQAEKSKQQSSAEDPPPRAARRPGASAAQALLRIAADWVTGLPATARRRAKLRATPLVDPLSGWARLSDGEFLPPAGATGLRLIEDADLTRYDLARTSREADEKLRRVLGLIDGERCRFPGCSARRHLHAHHVRPWSLGGPTDLANLVFMCSRHHVVIHEQGYVLRLGPDRQLLISMPDDEALPHHPPLPFRPAADLAHHTGVASDVTPTPRATDRLRLHYAVGVLLQQAA